MKYVHHDTFFYFLLPFSYFPLNIHHLVRDVGYLPHREGSNACASGELKKFNNKKYAEGQDVNSDTIHFSRIDGQVRFHLPLLL